MLTGILPTACTPSECGGMPASAAMRAISAIGWNRPELVIRVHHADEFRARLYRLTYCIWIHHASSVDRHQRVIHLRDGQSTAGCSKVVVTT